MGAETESQEKCTQEKPKTSLTQEQFLSWKRQKVSSSLTFPNSVIRIFSFFLALSGPLFKFYFEIIVTSRGNSKLGHFIISIQ